MHRPRLIFVTFLAASALGAFGCSSTDTGQSFAEVAELERAEQTAQVDLLCDCYAELSATFPDEASCIEAFTIPRNATIEDCRVAAFDLAPESSRAHLECQLEVSRDTTACLAETYTCTDTSAAQRCDELRIAALEACPPLATIVIDAQIECAAIR